MSDENQLHWNHTICPDTLEALAYSRSSELLNLGFDLPAAHLFAMLENTHRQQLAKSIGADAALLARLEWDITEKQFSCRLVPETLPNDLGKRLFQGFV
ncbi:hypothetical protein [Ruegeria aquimaris]|uniref:Uncharacterized protein n=1 Tax=Ruegeria aquimaris TaxID=2984333 RepID=A0ABT3APT4_9RHOB|nr:hypothetical protein [Ruegeria sp. XHP0148]MCV2890683.1 hypothetical protein [Ruegeria sp. XHP0148]